MWLVENIITARIPVDKMTPIDAIKFRMEQQGLTQADLVRAGCGQRSHVSEMLSYKRKITLKFIRAYHKICDATPLHVLIKDYKLKRYTGKS
jgi:HTH-type transcriptional regulator / antitoxin HigA